MAIAFALKTAEAAWLGIACVGDDLYLLKGTYASETL
jgi:hypothetical protein